MTTSAPDAIRLCQRLQRIADAVPVGSRVADIGADHALLCAYLIQQEIAPRCVVVEKRRPPWERARATLDRTGAGDAVDVRLGDGLGPITPGEVDVVCIAGMGSQTMLEILSAGADVLREVKRLVLQPMTEATLLRKWFIDHGWELVAEAMVEARGRIFLVMEAEQGDARRPYGAAGPTAEALAAGPLLLAAPTDTLKAHWRKKHRASVKALSTAGLDHRDPSVCLARERHALCRAVLLAIGADPDIESR